MVTTATISDESCGTANGSIDLTVSGGATPYTYLWSNGAMTEDLLNLSSGSYTCIITDNTGCDLEVTYDVLPTNGGLTLNGITNDEDCGNSDGWINLFVTGGTGPYIYSWSSGETTEDLSNISYGTYTVVVTDAGGCSATETYSIASTGNRSS